MRLTLLSVAILCNFILLQAQNVTIPDNEFKQALLSYSPTIDTNDDGEISFTEAAAVTVLNISNHHYEMHMDPDPDMGGYEVFGISDFTGIEAFVNLTSLTCKENDLTSLDVSALTQLTFLDCSSNKNPMGYTGGITTLTLPTTSTLSTIICENNYITTLDASAFSNLTALNCSSNNITSLTLPTTSTLTSLKISRNSISSLNTSAFTNLTELDCSYNNLTSLDIATNTSLTSFNCTRNYSITSLTLPSSSTMTSLNISHNQITTLDVSSLPNLTSVICNNNLITDVDVSYQTGLTRLWCNNNQLTSLNLKNGNNSAIVSYHFSATSNPDLNLICVDDIAYATSNFTSKDASATFTNICSFTPSGSNTITGRVSFDVDANGCSPTDIPLKNKKIKTLGTTTGNLTFTNNNGEYTLYTLEEVMNTEIIPNLPAFFTVTPITQSTTFTGTGNTEVIDFCVTATSAVNDLKVYSYSITEVRPGFDTAIRVFFENNGSTTLSGAVTLNFEDTKETFLNASTAPDSTTSNSLTWNYTNLLPFERRFIDVHFNINTPTDPVNPVNGDDLINYTTSITPTTGDINLDDNTNLQTDIVVNSYDPNDVTCFQGNRIKPTEVPNFLEYRIRFQNTGTASAINIEVKTELDANLDWDTFEPIEASHSYRTVISDDNKVSFMFENIHLADSTSNEPESHGWVLYKIKPKATAIIGDASNATAGIYFDYNPPVITNTATTTVSAVTNIPDDNFEQALIDLNLDTVLDDEVFTNDVNVVTTLNVSGKSISDLTGIEDFSALENLNFTNNLVESVNISNNTALEILNCAGNLLTSLDISVNTALNSVQCSNNSITNLDASANTALTYFQCADNQLTDLNIKNGNNTNIIGMSFNASNNPNLTCIEVDNATWSSANWTNIDTASTFVNNSAECTALSTEKFDKNTFAIYPNPVVENLTINSLNNGTFKLYNIRGKILKKGKIEKGNNLLQLHKFATGIYFLKFTSTKNKEFVSKIIKL